MDELKPIIDGLTREPVAFLGGLFSGFLKLNLYDEPVKSWLDQQGTVVPTASASTDQQKRNDGPQSISID
ncbi:MAG: hypothetical protein HC825_10995 [Oscillatoriales cyanobacterium RM1_1_9]|nr:hypothetical protein [Oscillatoriales cyanobacterium SM2_3_0]NJO46719.1 hypothetical protein [Oscillatoriales cyanobacterium RM2_1_1]NJO72053.1 hypothetical protein [Oscillatoriales cyanobacterium RM1_1_9]